jgi:uncharacterized membrane protein YdbT with pleckstrin-like domain
MSADEPHDATSTAPEKSVWQGTPSQLINTSQFLLWGAVLVAVIVAGALAMSSMEAVPSAVVLAFVAALLVPLAIIAWKWLVIANTRYELTSQRLRTRTGVLNKHFDELELYRVRDYKLEQPFLQRLFSLSTVILTTSDKSNPLLVLRAIPRGELLREQMRTYVEEARTRRGVREVDFE